MRSGAEVCKSCRSRQELSFFSFFRRSAPAGGDWGDFTRVFICKTWRRYSRERATQSLPKNSQQLEKKLEKSLKTVRKKHSPPPRSGPRPIPPPKKRPEESDEQFLMRRHHAFWLPKKAKTLPKCTLNTRFQRGKSSAAAGKKRIISPTLSILSTKFSPNLGYI